ncbi:MAG: VWA domain-containing protein [Polyangiaceae bacterium]|nr:VWA domain-containing protein [Polyangiaceae bacterium]
MASFLRTLIVTSLAVCWIGCSDDNTSTSASGSGGEGGLFETGIGGSQQVTECKNVDILFVIDDSGSMGDNQESLINSFPGFVSAIQKGLSSVASYHIGVVTTDDYKGNEPGCAEIGDLVTQTGGVDSSNAVCGPFDSGRRYMDETESDLAGKFACAANVGVSGADDERVARALLNAVAPERNGPGACNEGFSRLDSLLIAVLITDEDDAAAIDPGCQPDQPPIECQTYGSGGTSEEWYNELVAAKGGVHENIVMLSLIGSKDQSECGAVFAKKLLSLTVRFGENGLIGDVCSPSYDEFFAQTLPIIDTACSNYVEPK